MKIQTLLLISITTSLVLSLAATLASYNISHSDPRILDVSRVYRGWPLHWVIESWSYWGRPPYPHYFTFQPVDFLIDLLFYAIVFQMPMQLYLYSKEVRKPQIKKQPNKQAILSRANCVRMRMRMQNDTNLTMAVTD